MEDQTIDRIATDLKGFIAANFWDISSETFGGVSAIRMPKIYQKEQEGTKRRVNPRKKLTGGLLALFTRCSAIIFDDANLPVRFYVGALHFREVPDALLSKLAHYLLGRY